MTDIIFYVSKQDGFEERLKISYRLIALALKHKLKIHIHTKDIEMSRQIDQLLWSFEATSFVSHTMIDDNIHTQETLFEDQVVISHEFEPMNNCDYLINLSDTRPSFFSRFSKLAEIIDSSEEILSAGRERYAFYRDRGYNLKLHKI